MTVKKKFGNILDVPMPSSETKNHPKGEAVAVIEWQLQLMAREEALFELYGLKYPGIIEDKNIKALISIMARELKIPAFKIIGFDEFKKLGRPPTWKGVQGMKLWALVKLKEIEKPNESLRKIIDIVRRKHFDTEKLDSIYVRYGEIIKDSRIVHIFERVLNNYEKEPGKTIEGKIEILKSILEMADETLHENSK